MPSRRLQQDVLDGLPTLRLISPPSMSAHTPSFTVSQGQVAWWGFGLGLGLGLGVGFTVGGQGTALADSREKKRRLSMRRRAVEAKALLEAIDYTSKRRKLEV